MVHGPLAEAVQTDNPCDDGLESRRNLRIASVCQMLRATDQIAVNLCAKRIAHTRNVA